MNAFVPLLVAPFVGSFVGLLVKRLPTARSVVVGRSRCDSCQCVLKARDLIPVVSWLALRGRCRHCGQKLESFYPVIELAALATALWAAFVLPGDLVWAGCILGWTLLGLACIDGRHLMLSDELTLPLTGAGLAVAFLADPPSLPHHVLGAALGYSAFWALAWGYRRLRRREGLGMGDAKLMAAAGAWVSWTGLASIVFLGALMALAWVAWTSLRGAKISAQHELPFGPALCLATWVVWLYGPLVPE